MKDILCNILKDQIVDLYLYAFAYSDHLKVMRFLSFGKLTSILYLSVCGFGEGGFGKPWNDLNGVQWIINSNTEALLLRMIWYVQNQNLLVKYNSTMSPREFCFDILVKNGTIFPPHVWRVYLGLRQIKIKYFYKRSLKKAQHRVVYSRKERSDQV